MTFTCNESKTQGVSHLREWKESKWWGVNFEGYDDLSDAYQTELIMAMIAITMMTCAPSQQSRCTGCGARGNGM